MAVPRQPKILTTLWLILTVAVLSSCRHPLEIMGQGSITTLSGARGCTFDQFNAGDPVCTDNEVIGQSYDETYVATPEPGSGMIFKGWRTYCPYNNLSNECRFTASAAQVANNAGKKWWPLIAEFIPDCTGDPTCTVSFAPILGAVTDTSIKIWQATLGDAVFQVHYRLPGAALWSESSLATFDAASGFAGTVELTGLQAGTLYEYKTLLNGIEKYTSTFSTLPTVSTPGFDGKIRFGMANDLLYLEKPFLALGQAATKNFDFMLLIGDLMYADVVYTVDNNPAAYRGQYWNTWDEPNFAALSTTTPMFMMWDDHEIVDDFFPGIHLLHGEPDRYPAARTAYESYAHSHNPDTTGDVLYYSFSVPGADFFVLDTRSYRSSGYDTDDEDKTMLGEVQLNALLNYLETRQSISTAAFKFIVTSVPFSLGESSRDTWAAYQTEREYILSEIEARGITNVAFLSGDRHFSGIYRIISPGGYVYYDFLPSPTGATNRTAPVGNPHPGKEEVIYTSDTYKIFGDFQINLAGATPTLRAAFVDQSGVNRCVVTIGNDETGVLAGKALAACAPPPGC